MTIEELYENWQERYQMYQETKKIADRQKKNAEEAKQLLFATIFDKRDSHSIEYGKQIIQSGRTVFSFNFTGESKDFSIEDFKKVNYPSLDD